jgi:hypothetical protein
MRLVFQSRVTAGPTSAVAEVELTQRRWDAKSPRKAAKVFFSAFAPLRLCVEPSSIGPERHLHTYAVLLVLGVAVVIYLVMGR